MATSTTRKRSRSARRRSDSLPVFHPERLWRLWARAGWLARILTMLLLLVSVLGGAFLAGPFRVITTHPAPPPLEVALPCPPPVVSAFAGAGGLSNPVPSVPEMAAVQDGLCAGFGRQRALTGLLLLLAGLINATAVLEWARLRRRAKRRKRRAQRVVPASARPAAGGGEEAPSAAEDGPSSTVAEGAT